MNPGLQIGQTAEVDIVVSQEMHARFAGETVHELYSTSALVHHMEWAARKTILPYLEHHEEGMGSHVEVSHLQPTPGGATVKVKATVTGITKNKVECAVEAFNTDRKIARGTVTQAIVEKSWLAEKIRQISLSEGRSK